MITDRHRHSPLPFHRQLIRDVQRYDSALMFGDRSICVHEPSLEGEYSTIGLRPDVAVSLFDTKTYRPFRLRVGQQLPHLIEFGFVLSGSIHAQIAGCRKAFDTYPGQSYTSVYAGDVRSEMMIPADQHLQVLEIRFTPAALDQTCRDLGIALPEFLKNTIANGTRKPLHVTSVANRAMKGLVREIVAAFHDHTPEKQKMDDAVFALLDRYFAFIVGSSMPKHVTLSPNDIERVREARHLLLQDLEHPPSLVQLARQVTLNDFKLKAGFRQAFGMSAYQCLKQERLHKAHRLLKESIDSVTNVALAVGYRNLGDFGIAFKQRYGVTPTQLRATKKSASR